MYILLYTPVQLWR